MTTKGKGKDEVKKDDENIIVYRKYGEGDVEFVLNNLSEDDKSKLDAHPLDAELLWQMSDKALELGFVVTQKFDSYSKAWQGSLTCNAKGMLNTGLAVSGRSSLSGGDALFVALFKLFYVAAGDLTQFRGTSPKRTNVRG
jgi:hypothetical protein